MHEERYCGGIQDTPNKGVNNLTKQMAIFTHKNKICGKAKNYLLKNIGGAKAPPPAPRLRGPYSKLLTLNGIVVRFEGPLSVLLQNAEGLVDLDEEILVFINDKSQT